MGLASILVALLSMLFIGLGFLFTPVPVVGALFAFGAPALALVAVALGGVAMSRAKRDKEKSDGGQVGVILGALSFLPGVAVAITCGMCNAALSSGDMQVQRNFQLGGPQAPLVDGGMPMPSLLPLRQGPARPGAPGTTPAPAAPPPPPGHVPPPFPPPPIGN